MKITSIICSALAICAVSASAFVKVAHRAPGSATLEQSRYARLAQRNSVPITQLLVTNGCWHVTVSCRVDRVYRMLEERSLFDHFGRTYTELAFRVEGNPLLSFNAFTPPQAGVYTLISQSRAYKQAFLVITEE